MVARWPAPSKPPLPDSAAEGARNGRLPALLSTKLSFPAASERRGCHTLGMRLAAEGPSRRSVCWRGGSTVTLRRWEADRAWHLLVNRREQIMRHRFWFSVLVALAGLLLIPAIALAATNGTADSGTVIVHVNTPVTLSADNSIDVLLEVNDNATVAGTVNQTLVIVNGDATVSGVVSNEVFVVNGTLNLDPTARVDNVTLINSTLNQATGSQVTGTIRQQSQLISSS